MRWIIVLLAIVSLAGCRESPTPAPPAAISEEAAILAPLIDPAKLDTLKGNKVTLRQVQLGRKWNEVGLLSDEGLAAVETPPKN